MTEEEHVEEVRCPECGAFATLRLQASGRANAELGDVVSKCRHGLIGMAVLACSSFRPAVLAGQKRLRDPSI